MAVALGLEDVEAVLAAVETLSLAADHISLMRQILVTTSELIPSDSCSVNWMAPGRVCALVWPELAPDVFERLSPVLARHWSENPLAEHLRRTGDTRALTWDDVADDGWRAGSLHREFYRPLGVTQQLAVRLPSPPDTVAGLVCNRSSTPFDHRDRAVLTVFGRHVAAQMGASRERSALQAVFGRGGWRTLHVDADGTVVGGGPLQQPDADAGVVAPALARLIARQAAPRADGRLVPGDPTQVDDGAGGAVVAFVVPAPIPPHLLFVRDADRIDTGIEAAALGALGLTARQAEVASLLATGATNLQMANQLHITVGTVKKHLQQVFTRLGVETRAAAAAVVVRANVS